MYSHNEMIEILTKLNLSSSCNLPSKSPTAGNLTQVNSTNMKYYQDDGKCTFFERNNGSFEKVPCKFGWKFDLEQRQSTIMTEV